MRATTQSPVETIEVEGRKIDINPDGYMIDRSLWTPAIAEALAFQGTKIAGLPKPYDCIDG